MRNRYGLWFWIKAIAGLWRHRKVNRVEHRQAIDDFAEELIEGGKLIVASTGIVPHPKFKDGIRLAPKPPDVVWKRGK